MANNNEITFKDVFGDSIYDKPIYPCWSIRVADGDFERFELGQEEEIITELNNIKKNINDYAEYSDYEEEEGIKIVLYYEVSESCIKHYYETTIKI